MYSSHSQGAVRVEPETALRSLKAQFALLNGCAERILCDNREELKAAQRRSDGAHQLPYFHGGNCGLFRTPHRRSRLRRTLQTAIDALQRAQRQEVDISTART